MLPLGVAVLALLAVVVTLVGVGRATQGLRDEVIHVVEPARNHLYELQRLLALEEAEQRGGAPAPVIGSALPPQGSEPGAEQRMLSALAPLLREIGPEATEALADIRASVRQWQARSRTPTAGGPDPGAELAYAEALAAADRLHAAVNRAAAERRARIVELERAEAALIIGMVVLALVSILVLARTGQRQMALVRESRRLSTESERRRRELERVSEEKAQFIRGVTHDLKNPLGAIDAYAQLLEAEIKGTLSEDERQYVRRIRGAVQQVLGTVQDLLELAQAEARGLSIDRRAADLSAVAASVAEDYRAAMESGGLVLILDPARDLPRVATDARRVREVLGNLLSNAAKYVPRGGRVVVRTRKAEEGGPGPGPWLVAEVADTGPGIPPEEQERIFAEFHRVEGQTASGSGVGLAISRRIARLLGGDLTVESRPGEGCTFSLWLPVPAPDPVTPADERPGAAPGDVSPRGS
ncbi:MAG TPA: HAMP domain-containing sensor histidine kinase [Thermoleophilaceae bacterium]|nr:HAMP domain-containing sensor histidine kinase [Thermoleophilaceae bacterium]